MHVFPQVRGIFSHYLFKKSFLSFLSSLSGIFIMWILVCLMVCHKFLIPNSFFFFFNSCNLMYSTALSSSLQILSSASSSFILKISIKIFIYYFNSAICLVFFNILYLCWNSCFVMHYSSGLGEYLYDHNFKLLSGKLLFSLY